MTDRRRDGAESLWSTLRKAKVGELAVATACVLGVLILVGAAFVAMAARNSDAPTPPTQVVMVRLGAPPSAAAGEVAAAQSGAPAAAAAPAKLNVSGLADDGIPIVALDAYRSAAARLGAVDPSCGIDWALLAGIGRVESDHGRFGGTQLYTNGNPTLRIVGPALDGRGGTPYLPSTDAGRYDGDLRYAHAVGPMQFLPSTWDADGVDGNRDGVADPFNIYDAALTAARYLCAAGGSLRTTGGRTRAVYSYNHSNYYVAEVLALADAYARGVDVGVVHFTVPAASTDAGAPPTVRDVGPASAGQPPGLAPGPTTPSRTRTATPPPAPATTSANPVTDLACTLGSSSSRCHSPH